MRAFRRDMKRNSLQLLAVFFCGVVAAYAGVLILVHHVQEPLALSVHFAWYDWFMYLAYPGFTLASGLVNVYSPVGKEFTMAVIAFANGVAFSAVWLLLLVTIRIAGTKIGAEKS